MKKGLYKKVSKRDTKMFEKAIEKLGLDKGLKSTDVITRRAAITILIKNNNCIIEQFSQPEMCCMLNSVCGIPFHPNVLSGPIELVKQFKRRADLSKRLQQAKMVKAEHEGLLVEIRSSSGEEAQDVNAV